MTTPLSHHLGALLGPLPEAARTAAESAHRLTPMAGDALLRDGERWQHLWWVVSGAFRLYYLDREGQAANKNFYLEGAMFWPITPDLADQPVGFWVEALEASEVWALPWAAWQNATVDFAPWQRLERYVLAGLLQDKMRREQQFLQDTATSRYQALRATHPDWMQRVPLKHLASYLGITDVALSRIRRRLNPG
ncbi:MAG TPA: Crp/Fnr family transcriptional regulator [Hydrogenophaga sp.]|nr:Crp/Fnr family transcriptional regulator [Hydrogenophaga sp.]